MGTGGALIGALRVSLGLDSAEFEAGTKKARARAKSDVNAIQQEFGRVKTAGKLLVGGFLGSEIIAAGKRALDYASSLAEVAQQLGVTTRDLQVYRFAATQVGISQEEMDKGLAKLTVTIGKAKAGSKEQATTFRELGVAVQDANGRVYTAGEVMPKLADALARIKDPATRARIEVELFGRTGQKLDTLLAGGSGAINQLSKAAQDLGIVLSDQQIQNADRTADKLAELKMVLEANIAGVVADNATSIYNLASSIAKLSGELVHFAASNPKETMAMIGALAGLRFGSMLGPYGAIGGAALGGFLGYELAPAPARTKDRVGSDLKTARANYANLTRPGRGYGRAGAGISMRANPREVALAKAQVRVFEAEYAKLSRQMPPAKPKAVVPDGALPTVAGGGGKSRKSRGPTGPSDIDRAENFQQDMDRLMSEQLGLQQDITTDVRKRAGLELQRIDTETAAYDHEIDEKLRKGELNAADAERLKIQNARNADLKHMAVNDNVADQLLQQDVAAKREGLQSQLDILQAQASLARTGEERKRIELRILDLQMEMERAQLDAVLASHDATQAEKDIAAARIAQLGAIKGLAAANIERQNQGPLAQYMDQLPQTAEQLDEALQRVKVTGLQGIEDGLISIIDGTKTVAEAFRDMAKSIISDLLRISIQRAITIPLANALFGGGGSNDQMMAATTSGGGGLLGSLLGIAGNVLGSTSFGGAAKLGGVKVAGQSSPLDLKLPGFASGGSFSVSGAQGIDRNILAINGIPAVRVSHGERVTVDHGQNDNRRGPMINVGGVHITGTGDDRRDRRSGMQAAAGLRHEIARSVKGGF